MNVTGTSTPQRVASAFLPFVVAFAVHLVAHLTGAATTAELSKWTLMPLLALGLSSAVRGSRTSDARTPHARTPDARTPDARTTDVRTPASAGHSPRRLHLLVVTALVFSWLGDMLPHFTPTAMSFPVLIGMFAVAQACYVAAFWPYRQGSLLRTRWLIGYLLIAVTLVALCAPGAGPLAVPVLIYATLITTMAVLATGVHRLTGLGAAIFMASDSLIALEAFNQAWNVALQDFWVMASYGLAQLLIVLGVRARLAGPC